MNDNILKLISSLNKELQRSKSLQVLALKKLENLKSKDTSEYLKVALEREINKNKSLSNKQDMVSNKVKKLKESLEKIQNMEI